MPTRCESCLAERIEYRTDGTATCFVCGHVTPPAPKESMSVTNKDLPPHLRFRSRYADQSASAIVVDTLKVFAKGLPSLVVPYVAFSGLMFSLAVLALESFRSLAEGSNATNALARLSDTPIPLILFLAAVLVLWTLLAGATTQYVVLRHLGYPSTFRKSFKKCVSHVRPVLGASMAFYSLIFLFPAAGYLIVVLSPAGSTGTAAAGFLILFAGLALSPILATRLIFFPCLILLEGEKAWPSLKKSWKATRENRRSIFRASEAILLMQAILVIAATAATWVLAGRLAGIAALVLTLGFVGSWIVVCPSVAYSFARGVATIRPLYSSPPIRTKEPS